MRKFIELRVPKRNWTLTWRTHRPRLFGDNTTADTMVIDEDDKSRHDDRAVTVIQDSHNLVERRPTNTSIVGQKRKVSNPFRVLQLVRLTRLEQKT